MAQNAQTKREATVIAPATAKCGHAVKVFGTRERVWTLVYEVQFERCPTCIATCKY